ncbi:MULTISPECIES: universal stress protein [Nocardia]|uniref:universal stress protein n=1 Tax=Nocardia TaxID=1817 RepID=UPI0018E56FD8|nr:MULTISPECIES: universal stress protein [Nocardia]
MTVLANQRPIVVGIDGSRAAVAAARWTGAIAAGQRSPIDLVTVVPAPEDRFNALGSGTRNVRAVLRDAAKRALREAAAAVRGEYPQASVRERVLDGSPSRELIVFGDTARMLVVAASADDRFDVPLVGSTASRVATGAGCPVAVWRGDPARPMPDRRPILVGVDGSPGSDAALGHAFELAEALGVGIVAVHAWNDPDLWAWTPLPDTWDVASRHEEELLDERLSGWSRKYPAVAVARVVHKSRTARALLEHALGAQLVVTGSWGYNRSGNLSAGSTSRNLLHHASCPTLVCHG